MKLGQRSSQGHPNSLLKRVCGGVASAPPGAWQRLGPCMLPHLGLVRPYAKKVQRPASGTRAVRFTAPWLPWVAPMGRATMGGIYGEGVAAVSRAPPQVHGSGWSHACGSSEARTRLVSGLYQVRKESRC